MSLFLPTSLAAVALGMICASAGARSAQAAMVPVELELVLAVDTSASVDDAEFRLQMDGLANAFRDPDVIAAIEGQGPRGIAVTLVHWSEGPRQSVGWRHVHDRASAERFSSLIGAAPRLGVGHTTAIGSAIRYSVQLLSSSRFAGRRRSIDVSGDGRNNAGHPIWGERKRAVASGVTINGLAILNGDPKLESYYEAHVVGGHGAFVVTAEGFADFARAIRVKLLREINPVVARGEPGLRETAGISAEPPGAGPADTRRDGLVMRGLQPAKDE